MDNGDGFNHKLGACARRGNCSQATLMSGHAGESPGPGGCHALPFPPGRVSGRLCRAQGLFTWTPFPQGIRLSLPQAPSLSYECIEGFIRLPEGWAAMLTTQHENPRIGDIVAL